MYTANGLVFSIYSISSERTKSILGNMFVIFIAAIRHKTYQMVSKVLTFTNIPN